MSKIDFQLNYQHQLLALITILGTLEQMSMFVINMFNLCSNVEHLLYNYNGNA